MEDMQTKTKAIDLEPTVSRFLKLGSQKLDFSEPCLSRGRARDTQILIRRDKGQLRIAYEFKKKEAAILELLSEVSGISLEALANDAASWTRSYINELPEYATGQVFDLLDDDKSAFGAEIPRGYRKRTRAFLEGLKNVWRIDRNGVYRAHKQLAT